MDAVHTAPPPALERPRVVSVGTALASAGIMLFFAALIGIYLVERSAALSSPEGLWLQDVNIPLRAVNTMAVTMLSSCVTVSWALWALNRNDRVNAYLALGLSILFGGAVINSHYWLYTQMELAIGDSLQALFVYVITGSFLALLASAMVYLGLVSVRVLAGEYGPNQSDAPAAAVLYWYVMVGVFLLIWYAVYITK